MKFWEEGARGLLGLFGGSSQELKSSQYFIWPYFSHMTRIRGLVDVAGGFTRTMAHELQNVGTWDQFDLDARLAANASLWLLDIGPRIGPTGTEYPEGLGR